MQDFYKERQLEVPTPQLSLQAREDLRKSWIPTELDMSLTLQFIGANEGMVYFKPLEKQLLQLFFSEEKWNLIPLVR